MSSKRNSKNESDIEAKQNALKLAEIDLQKYREGEYVQALKDVEGRIETARSDLENVCLGSDGGQSLFCAFTLPEAMDSVVAVEVVVNIQLASGSLPAWWQLAPGGCRFGALHSSAYLPRSSTCVDFWRGEAAGPSQEYLVGVPHLGNQAQIHVAFSVPSNTPRSLDATDLYFAARIDIGDDSTKTCAGCDVPACLVLNSIGIGLPPDRIRALVTPGPGDANRVTWQGGANASCSAVPARRPTWGQLKSLYR